jgi:hypothetical protein
MLMTITHRFRRRGVVELGGRGSRHGVPVVGVGRHGGIRGRRRVRVIIEVPCRTWNTHENTSKYKEIHDCNTRKYKIVIHQNTRL